MEIEVHLNQNYIFIICVSLVDRSKTLRSYAIFYLRKYYKKGLLCLNCYLPFLGQIYSEILGRDMTIKALMFIKVHTQKHS